MARGRKKKRNNHNQHLVLAGEIQIRIDPVALFISFDDAFRQGQARANQGVDASDSAT